MAGFEALLTGEIGAALIVFARIGAAFAVLPGFAEAFVSMRIRLMIALAVTLVLTPVLAPAMPAVPTDPLGLTALLAGESLVGLFLGALARMTLAALQVAGMIIGLQTNLANAFAIDPNISQQAVLTGVWLSAIGLTLVFVTELHHLMLRALVDSYAVFRPGEAPALGDAAQAIARVVGDSFRIGVKIAAPFLVFGFVFMLMLGLLQRLMPQVQVFFIAMPLQVMLGLALLGITLALGMRIFLDDFATVLSPFVR